MKLAFLVFLASLGCGSVTATAVDAGAGGSGGAAADALLGDVGSGGAAPATGGAPGTGGSGQDTAGSGGAPGTGGMVAGTGGTGGMLGGPGGAAAVPGPCTARFNFEDGATYGAAITADGTAIKSVANEGTRTYCGNGALVLNVAASGASGPSTNGYVVITLPAQELWVNKTVSMRLQFDPMVPAPGPSVGLFVETPTGLMRVTSAGGFPAGWAILRAMVTADVRAVRVQFVSIEGYAGKLYIDEISSQ